MGLVWVVKYTPIFLCYFSKENVGERIMKTNWKRISKRGLALLLSLAIVITLTPTLGLASDEVQKDEPAQTEQVQAEQDLTAPDVQEDAVSGGSQEAAAEEADAAPADEDQAGQVEEQAEEGAAETDAAAEEQPEKAGPPEEGTKEEAKEEAYPAASFVRNAGGMTVGIKAPEGALPEGASVEITPVDAGSVESAVKSEVGENVSVLKAVDISFFDKDGRPIEPKKRVSVQFVSDEFKSAADPMVVHIDDAGDAAKVADRFVDANGKSVGFEAKDFSIYVVVEGEVDPDARLNVNFYAADGETLIAEMSITQQQLQDGQLNVNIYDPGVGTMETGDIFKGWTEKKDFDVDDAEDGFDIAEVRTRVTNLLNSGEVEDGDKIDFYAMMFKSYHISYRDELGVTIYTDEVLYKKGAEDIPYTFQFAYTPYYVTGSDDDDETKAANFDGWMLMEPEESPAPVYDNGDSVDLADFDLSGSNLTLTVMAQVAYGHWLVFNENGSGVSFTPPLFVGTDETPETAGMPEPPTRTGYTFKGWYTSDDCTTEFDETQSITETTNVWAKWEENEEASFSVLIWRESLSGGYDFVRSINIADAATGDTMSDVISGEAGASTISVDGNSVFIPMNDDDNTACAGFMYKEYDTNTDDRVSSDGKSVLNIYFERRTYNLKFYYARSQRGSYQVPQIRSQDGTAESFNGTGGSWAGSGNTQPGSAYGTDGNETRGSYTYYYRVLTAKYGEEIGDKWPTYNGTDFATWNGYRQGSWAVMRNSGAYQNDRQGTVKGKITVMDEHILGDLASRDGNYVFANYDTASSQYSWIYHIYFRNEAGEDEHYEDVDALSHDSGNNWATQQHPPSYPGMEEFRRTRVGNNREVNYYYAPLDYPILFMDGLYVDGNGTVIDNKSTNTIKALEDDEAIAYRSSVAKYNSYDPTDLVPDGARFVFLGWYSDDQCTKEYTFDKMPVGGIKVYAKWMLKEYKVVLHPRADGDSSFKYINGNPAGEYGRNGDEIYVDNGENVANVGGTRDLYDLIGWFTNEKLSRVWDFDAFPLNDTIVGKYGELYGLDGTDGRYDPEFPGTVGEINLYANWRRILDGADGINVVYTAVGEDGDGNTVVGSNEPLDNNKYSDQAQAIALPAATAPETDPPLAFQYWVVQKWTGGDEYEDTDQHVFPGDRFIVDYDDAKVEDDESEGAAEGAKIYTVQLRAQYASAEDATPTHIYWYDNYTDSESGILHKNEDLAINEAVDIQPAPERKGYEFLGWARMAETDGGSPKYTYDLDEDDLLVTYDSETGEYTFETNSGNVKPANGVFADENNPYQGMYAVWKELDKLTYDKNGGSGEDMEPTTGHTGDAVTVSENTYTREGYAFTGWNTAADGTGTAYEEGAEYTLTEGEDILYAQWESTTAEYTVSHYLRGTDTVTEENRRPVSDPVSETGDIGDTFTPEIYSGKYTYPETGDEYDLIPYSYKVNGGEEQLISDGQIPEQTIVSGGTEVVIYYVIPVTLKADDRDIFYGDPIPTAFMATSIGTIVHADGGRETVTSNDRPTTDATAGSDAGKYDITLSGDEIQSYYKVTFEKGTLTIKPKEVLVVVKGNVEYKRYTGSEQTVSGYTIDVPENSGITEEDITTKPDQDANVARGTDPGAGPGHSPDYKTGVYPMGLSIDQFDVAAEKKKNYAVRFDVFDGWLEILPAQIGFVITIDYAEKPYNGEEQSYGEIQAVQYFSSESSGLADLPTGVSVSIKDDAAGMAKGKDVGGGSNEDGTYPTGFTADDFTFELGNYYELIPEDKLPEGRDAPVSITQGYMEITPVEVTVTAEDKTKVEGEDDPELTAAVEGLMGSDTVEYSLSREEGEDPGTYTITAAGEEDQGNYIVTFADGTLTITEKAAPPEPADEMYTITYDLNGGEYDGSTDDIVETHAAGETITIHEAPTRDGYEFLFWKGSEYQPGDSYTVEGDHTFVAQWKKTDTSDDDADDDPDNDTDSDTDNDTGNDTGKDKPGQDKSGKSPKTGDDFSIMMMLIAMAVSGGALVFGIVRRRREED